MNFWLTVRPPSLILILCLDLDLVFVSHSFPLWMSELALLFRNSMDSIPADKVHATGYTKTFPDVPCMSQMPGGPSLLLGIPRERLSIPPGIG